MRSTKNSSIVLFASVRAGTKTKAPFSPGEKMVKNVEENTVKSENDSGSKKTVNINIIYKSTVYIVIIIIIIIIIINRASFHKIISYNKLSTVKKFNLNFHSTS